MKPRAFAIGAVLFAMAVIVLVVSGVVSTAKSGYEAENCEMGCRVVFDAVLDPTNYANCVEQCRRYLSNKPEL